ncbi:MAG: hypothetical protein JRD89_20800 [Deltaproteobacteria bacterium]|nr:hypothetical protein [Deltaproteobacteria bacterium]
MNFNDHRIVTLNCGVGRDSITMLCLLFERNLEVEGLGKLGPQDIDCVVFSDTGCEWRHTYDLIPTLRQLCNAHGVRFIILEKGDGEEVDVEGWLDIERKARTGGYHIRPSVMADFQSRATVASLGKGDCTDNHKLCPIRRLVNDISLVRFGRNNRSYSSLVRKGERHLGNGKGRTPAYLTEAYPLITMNISKPDEAVVLERWELNHVMKSGCFMCPYQPAGWYWALSVTDPATFAAVVEYEKVALERNPRMRATGAKVPVPQMVAK